MNSDILCYPSFQSPQTKTNVSALIAIVTKVWDFDCSIEKIIHTIVIHSVNYRFI